MVTSLSRFRVCACLSVFTLAALAFSTRAYGWSPRTQMAISDKAAAIAPADLRRQIERHRREFRRGLLAPFEGTASSAHVQNADGRGDLESTVLAEAERAVRAIRAHRPFRDVVRQLGVVAHFVADANNPLATADGNPREADYFGDYLRYVESAQGRFPVVFYSDGRGVDGPEELRALLAASFSRGRELYPFIGLEYSRVGRVDGIGSFDDRSTAFGVGSLAFSHAVSDIAAVLRYIWLRAGGADERNWPARLSMSSLGPRIQQAPGRRVGKSTILRVTAQ